MAVGDGKAAPPPNPRFMGSPFMQVWSTEDLGASPVNNGVAQNPQSGFVYVSNNNGVLEFDGVRWRLIALPGGAAGRTVSFDARGRLWYLSSNSVGRLEPDSQGELRAVHAMNRLSANERVLGVTIGALAQPDGMYFSARQRLVFFPSDDAAPAQTWKLAAPLVSLWEMEGMPHVALRDGTWWRVRNRRLEPAAVAKGPAVFAARTAPAGDTTLLTPNGPWRPSVGLVGTAAELANEPADNGVFLADGRIAFGTASRGLLLFDSEGKYLTRIDRTLGLPANRVQGLCEDREGGVWLALHRGAARLQLDSPYAAHGHAQRIFGTPHAVARLDGRLFVAHSEGLVVADELGGFMPTTHIPGGFARALVPGHEVFASAALQWLAPATGPGDVVDRTPWDRLVPLSGGSGKFALGTKTGLYLARSSGGSWQILRHITAVGRLAKPQVEAPAGMLWVVGGARTWRIDFRGGVNGSAPVRLYGATDGLPPGRPDFGLLGGQAVVLVGGRLLRYDAAADRFVPETRIAGLAAEDLTHAAGVGNDNDGTLWISEEGAGGRFLRVVLDGVDHWRAEPTEGAHLGQRRVITFHDTATHSQWFAGRGALVSMDLDWRPSRAVVPLVAVVRRVVTSAGAAVTLPVLNAKQTALRFEFAAPAYQPDFRGVTGLNFRSRIDGLDLDWTPWSDEPFREIANLPFGDLRLRVQARDAFGRESGEATLSFAIAAPWWRTRWAMLGETALGGLVFAGAVRLRTRALRRRAAALEAVVAERTATLHTQNEELLRLHRLELDENASLRLAEEKARLEVLRYQLNPHFLYNSLNSIYGLLFENARGAGEMVLRLSEFCRATLTVRDGEPPTLGAEMQVLRIYLDVEKVRWGDGLQVEFAVEPEVESMRLPPFLLLPLVENAVKYGGRTSPGTLHVKLSARRERGAAVIKIANSGQWLAPDPARKDSTGLGIENLRERLTRHFPGAHEFTFETETETGWVVAKLTLGGFPSPNPPHLTGIGSMRQT